MIGVCMQKALCTRMGARTSETLTSTPISRDVDAATPISVCLSPAQESVSKPGLGTTTTNIASGMNLGRSGRCTRGGPGSGEHHLSSPQQLLPQCWL